MRATPALFKGVLLGSLALGIMGGSLDLIVPGLIPESLVEEEAAVAGAESDTYVLVMGGFTLLLLIALVAVYVGLFKFRPWARRLAVVVTVIGPLMHPALGIELYSGWALMLTDASATLWGIALALAFFSPLNERFAGALE